MQKLNALLFFILATLVYVIIIFFMKVPVVVKHTSDLDRGTIIIFNGSGVSLQTVITNYFNITKSKATDSVNGKLIKGHTMELLQNIHNISRDDTETKPDNHTGSPLMKTTFNPEPSTIDESLLTLFTTLKNDNDRFQIHVNCLHNWAKLKPYVTLVLFDMDTNRDLLKLAKSLGWDILKPSKLNGGIPTLKELYFDAAKRHHSTFYGYSNGDILYDHGLISTLKIVRDNLNLLNRTLLVGQRTNVNVAKNETFNDPGLIRSTALQKGKLFRKDAEDYFLIAHNKFIWEKVPDIVIGRPAYDNFLVAIALDSNISVVDTTHTVVALHQSGSDGDYAGHKNSDKNINLKVIGSSFPFTRGVTSNAQFYTTWNARNEVEIWRRSRTGNKKLQ